MDATSRRVLEGRYHEKALQEIVKRNKRCADCLKPSPSYANLNVGSFVCLECSGLLREFGFRTKGVGLSTFTPQEVQMLDLSGGNKRANEVWMGRHPDGEKATPGWDNLEILRRFLVQKYQQKQWYDEAAAAKPAEPVRSRADSASSPTLELSPAVQGRKRVGSKDGVINRGANSVMTGQTSHRSFLAATHARAAAQSAASNGSGAHGSEDDGNGTSDDEDDESDDSYEDVADAAERERRRRQHVRKGIEQFYKVHNPEKLDSLDIFVEWVMYHGMGAFNKKLREKYGTDIPSDRKRDLKTRKEKRKAKEQQKAREQRPLRKEILDQAAQLAALEEAAQAMALHDLASRKRAGSMNPFDDFPASPPSPSFTTQQPMMITTAGTSNPFDDLMFL